MSDERMELSSDQLFNLQNQYGFPKGLAMQIACGKKEFPIRYWIVDNSGSMRLTDGRLITPNNTRTESYSVSQCSRWKELQNTVINHATIAGIIKAPTIFRVLNGTDDNNVKEFAISETMAEDNVKEAVRIMEETNPEGATPLTAHLLDFHRRIQQLERSLLQRGSKAVIVIATDGLPSNEDADMNDEIKNEFITALQLLGRLPVWIVVRLCTDDDEVVQFYNNLDMHLEFPLEVLDDFFNEAKEINAVNPWLNYLMPLHRCREMGFQHRTMDFLDERFLNKDEIVEFLGLLFGTECMQNAPDIYTQFHKFSKYITKIVEAEGRHWCPTTRKLEYWINMKKFNEIYKKKTTP